jgi:hypothetical protein
MARTETFSAAGSEFEFDFYGRHFDCVGVNVKAHQAYDYKLPKGYKKKLETLQKESSVRDLENEYFSWAWDGVGEQWWEQATEAAQDRDLGKIECVGSQGGYLIVKKFTREYVFDIITVLESECAHCEQPYAQHMRGKCLFDHSQFQSAEPEYLKQLERLKDYLEVMQRDAKSDWIPESIAESMVFYIDRAWEERRNAKSGGKRRAVAGGRADDRDAHAT